MNASSTYDPDAAAFRRRTVFGIIWKSQYEQDDLYEYLTEFGDIESLQVTHSNDRTDFKVTFTSETLVKIMLAIVHDLHGIEMLVSDRPISSPQKTQRTVKNSQSFVGKFEPSSQSILQIEQMLDSSGSGIVRNNLLAFKSALLNGSLSSHCGQYVIVNNGIVEYNHIYTDELESIGKFSSASAMTLRIPPHPDVVLKPMHY